MRRLILSDIHSNFDALEAVLANARDGFDEVVCCGDLVGYNAAPSEVIEWARECAHAIVRGNHDRACCGLGGIETFNRAARDSALWTQEALNRRDLEWLGLLPTGPLVFDDYMLAHGSPRDEDDYLIDGADVEPLGSALFRKMCFIGHTHMQTGWSWQRGGLQRLPSPSLSEDHRVIDLDPDYLYLVNPGSVGQPRDGDPRAAYAIWDSNARLLHLRRVKYDVKRAQARVMDAGLPESLAYRLALGR